MFIKLGYQCVFLFLLIISSCDQIEKLIDTKDKKETSSENTAKTYHKNGTLAFETGVDSLNKRHGVARKFNEKGILESEFIYNHGEKIKAKSFYKNGNIASEFNYVNDKKNGLRYKYYENGKIQSIVNYKNDMAGKLSEYDKEGKLITNYPKLVINTIDRINFSGQFIIEVFFDNKSNKGDFYMGPLEDNEFLSLYRKELPKKDGKGILVYYINPGSFLMEKITISASYKTKLGNVYVTSITYNLAIER